MSMCSTNVDNRVRLSISERAYIAEDLRNANIRYFISIQRHCEHESVVAHREPLLTLLHTWRQQDVKEGGGGEVQRREEKI